MTHKSTLASAFAGLLVLAYAPAAAGQAASTGQRLDATISATEAYDSDVPTELLPRIDPKRLASGGLSTTLFGTARYGRQLSGLRLGATGASTFRYFGEVDEFRSLSHSAGLGVDASTPWQSSIFLNQTVVYSPSYLYGLFPGGGALDVGDAVLPAPDYATYDTESYSHRTSLRVRHELTRRSTVSLNGDFRYTNFVGRTAARRDVTAHGAGAQFSREVGRSAGFSMGYRYRSGQNGTGPDRATLITTTEHGVDGGVSYSRALSGTRRLTFTGRIGASSIDAPRLALELTEGISGDRLFKVDAELGVIYPVTRTWSAQGAYRRGMEYLPELPEPVYADSVNVGVQGQLTRRTTLSTTVGYSTGESLRNRNSLLFDTYTTSARVSYALTRTLSAYGQYLYYYYSFGDSTLLTEGQSGLERNGVRAGVTMSIPLVGR